MLQPTKSRQNAIAVHSRYGISRPLLPNFRSDSSMSGNNLVTGFPNPVSRMNYYNMDSDSLDQLLDDLATDRYFMHRIKAIHDLGNLLERIKTAMKHNANYKFIPSEKAGRIFTDMAGSTWFSGGSTFARKSRKNVKKKSVSGNVDVHNKSKSAKTKVNRNASMILQTAGYGTSSQEKSANNLLKECTRALEELASRRNKIPFRVVIPHREMTLPLRNAWKYAPSYIHQPAVYRENKSSRLRLEYLSRHSSQRFQVTTPPTRDEPIAQPSKSTAHVQCELAYATTCQTSESDLEYEPSESSNRSSKENFTNQLEEEEEDNNGVDENGNACNNCLKDESEDKENDSEYLPIIVGDDMEGIELNSSENLLCCEVMQIDSKDVYNTSLTTIKTPVQELSNEGLSSALPLTEITYITNDVERSTAKSSTLNSSCTLSVTSNPSSCSNPSDIGNCETDAQPSCTNFSRKVQSYPGSPSMSFLNVLSVNMKEVDNLHDQRNRMSTTPMAFDSYGTTDENFRMLMGLVGFPEIVRRKYLAKKTSPMVHAIITRGKPEGFKLRQPLSVLDTDLAADSEEYLFLDDSKSNNLIRRQHTIPSQDQSSFDFLTALHGIQAPPFCNDIVSETDFTQTMAFPFHESFVGKKCKDMRKRKSNTDSVADKLTDDVMNKMMNEFEGLLFSSEMH